MGHSYLKKGGHARECVISIRINSKTSGLANLLILKFTIIEALDFKVSYFRSGLNSEVIDLGVTYFLK